jgi:hypothetical protein
MGFKSSFPVMALFHHVIVAQAAIDAGVPEYKDYVILGDDIVLCNTNVATEYIAIMERLGMVVSISKTVSPGTEGAMGAEFASRIAYKGEEVSGLPVRAIVKTLRVGTAYVSLWDILTTRGFFKGQDVWTFLGQFLPKEDLKFLMLLNSLPKSVSGLKIPIPCSEAKGVSPEVFAESGIKMTDIHNFYYYVLITEAIGKIDAAVKRAYNMINVLETEGNTRNEEQNLFLQGTEQSLAFLVHNQASKAKSAEFLHPIQDIVKQVGSRLVNLLNRFNSSDMDYMDLLDSPDMGVLNFSLQEKAQYLPSPHSAFGDRRALEKAFRLVGQCLNSDVQKSVTYVGRIDGVTNLWKASVTLGGDLIVAPHVPKLGVLTIGIADRIKTTANEVQLASFIPMIPAKPNRKG